MNNAKEVCQNPFWLISREYYNELLEERGFEVNYLEIVGRTYSNMQECFELITVVGEKI